MVLEECTHGRPQYLRYFIRGFICEFVIEISEFNSVQLSTETKPYCLAAFLSTRKVCQKD
jgi:hypothetical protein